MKHWCKTGDKVEIKRESDLACRGKKMRMKWIVKKTFVESAE